MVKELRERTGAGMMECKKALTETGGDMEVAIDLMRKSGRAKADKKAGRVAAEGAIVISERGAEAAIVEINCETDFVAKDGQFRAFAAKLAELVLDQAPGDVEALKALPLPGAGDLSVEQARLELVSKIGENIQLRRFQRVGAAGDRLGRYLHGQRIGVLVDMKGGDDRLAKDIAMHIAASRPVCITEQDIPRPLLDKEKEILSAQAQDSGKPAHIIDKMVQGRLKKYLAEITLLGQPFVKDPDKTVGQLLSAAGAEVLSFIRLEVGEGIEKKAESFAQEVMAQVKGA
jgi:elongation factor Ts